MDSLGCGYVAKDEEVTLTRRTLGGGQHSSQGYAGLFSYVSLIHSASKAISVTPTMTTPMIRMVTSMKMLVIFEVSRIASKARGCVTKWHCIESGA